MMKKDISLIVEDFKIYDDFNTYDGIQYSLSFSHKPIIDTFSLFEIHRRSLYINELLLTPNVQRLIIKNPDKILFDIKDYINRNYNTSYNYTLRYNFYCCSNNCNTYTRL